MAKLMVHPKVAQFDYKLTIRIEGLKAKQRVTTCNELANEIGERFESFAEYEADAGGTVDRSTMPALNGTYTGVEPMGLFWSMVPVPGQQKGTRLLKRDASIPVEYHLSVLDSSGTTLAQENVQRTFLAPGFSRITVDEEGIKGRLFVPPGRGPFPAVIDMYGAVGGLIEHGASLLASKGFLVLALAYFGYEGLPKEFHFEMNYFEKSIEWLLLHPKVQRDSGVGVVGISKGAEIGMYLTTVCPQVKAVVSISGFPLFGVGQHLRKGEVLPSVESDFSRIEISEDYCLNARHCYENVDYHRHVFKFEDTNARFLVVTGEDDDAAVYDVQKAGVDRLTELGKDVTHLKYPSVGHIMEPPFTPFCDATYAAINDVTLLWGGKKVAQMKAQDDVWPKVIDFLHKSLQIKPQNSHL